LAQRPSTRPGVSGAESYPIRAEVIKVNRTTKANQKNIDLDNKHRLGLALTEPGTPNHLLCWFPAGQFKPGDAIQSDMIWDSLYAGSNIVGYDRKIIFKY
jgi:hypothetical protein